MPSAEALQLSARSTPDLGGVERNLFAMGTVALAEVCPQIGVPFEAVRLAKATVAWLNLRWFASRGYDISQAEERAAICDQLLQEFAFAVPQSHDQADAFTLERKTFVADRYGGTGTGANGGAGRVGMCGGFQVKGIGRTPLVDTATDALHSHGCQTLEEAIREAVYGELFDLEAPYGAVPVVAILLTGTRMPWKERRALSIRPNFVRVAHGERAYLFRSPARLDHLDDQARVREVIEALTSSRSSRSTLGITTQTLLESLSRVAETLAFAQAQRLYFGPCTASNITFDGKPFDFGSARALPNWESFMSVEGTAAFGLDDVGLFEASLRDLGFYFRKHAALDCGYLAGFEDAVPHFRQAHRFFLERELGAIAGLDRRTCSIACWTAVVAMLSNFFVQQQKVRRSVSTGSPSGRRPWLVDAGGRYPDVAAEEYERKILADIQVALEREFGNGSQAEEHMRGVRARLLPRPLLVRERLLSDIYTSVVEKGGDGGDAQEIRKNTSRLIAGVVSASRRVHRDLPSGATLIATKTTFGTSAYLSRCVRTGNKWLTMRGRHCNGNVVFFENRLSFEKCVGLAECVTVAMPTDYRGESTDVTVFGSLVRVPDLDIRFEGP